MRDIKQLQHTGYVRDSEHETPMTVTYLITKSGPRILRVANSHNRDIYHELTPVTYDTILERIRDT